MPVQATCGMRQRNPVVEGVNTGTVSILNRHDVRMSMIQVRISKTAMLEMMMNRDCREDGRLAWKPEKVAVIVLHFAPTPAIIIKLLRKTERMWARSSAG